MKQRLMFIAPLPPPVHGQAFVSKHLRDHLADDFELLEINYSRNNVAWESNFGPGVIRRIFNLGTLIARNKEKIDKAYLTIAQSLMGNLRDMYFLCRLGSRLRKNTVIHLHGGDFDTVYKRLPRPLQAVNKVFFRQIPCGIVLGQSLRKCLAPVLGKEKIVVIPNFYPSELKISQEETRAKWENPQVIGLLFLANFLKEKGYNELLEGFIRLPEAMRRRYRLSFAGEFTSDQDRASFMERINCYQNIRYHGVVSGTEKQELLHKSHALILPTCFVEGQPVSILESYASGMTVITTEAGGIPDIFTNGKNGRFVKARSAESITNVLAGFHDNYQFYRESAFFNWEFSANFTEERFADTMRKTMAAI